MDIQLSAFIIGFLASVVTEIFKFFPVLSQNEVTKVLTAVVVMAAGTLISLHFNVSAWDWNLFGQVIIWSFVNYKMIISPVGKTMGLVTQ